MFKRKTKKKVYTPVKSQTGLRMGHKLHERIVMDVQKGRKKKYKESMQRKRILFSAPYTPTDESMTTHRQTTGRHDNSATAIFHRQPTRRHDHWPTGQVTDNFLKNSPTLADTHRQSFSPRKGVKRNMLFKVNIALHSETNTITILLLKDVFESLWLLICCLLSLSVYSEFIQT